MLDLFDSVLKKPLPLIELNLGALKGGFNINYFKKKAKAFQCL